MALIIDSIEGMDPAEAAHFVKTEDGKFALKPLEDNSHLKSALAKEREAAKAGKQWERLGKTPDEIAELLKEKEERDNADALKRGEFEKMTAAQKAKFDEEREGFRKDLSKRDKALEQRAIVADATQAYLNAGADPKSVHQLVALTRGHYKLEETDDNFVVRVIGQDGRPRIADANGTPMGIEHIAAEIKANVTEYGKFFLGSGATGGGSTPSGSSTNGKSMARSAFESLTPKAQMEFMKGAGTIKE